MMKSDSFRTLRDYASIDLVFTVGNLYYMLNDEPEEGYICSAEVLGTAERGYYEWLIKLIKELMELDGKGSDELSKYEGIATTLKEIRVENKKRMDYLIGFEDREAVYNYVLDRLDTRYQSEEKLDDFLKSYPDEEFLNRVMSYLTADDNKHVVMTKFQDILSEIPLQVTRQKLYSHIEKTMGLYRDSDETSLDELLYMIKTEGLVTVYDTFAGEYPGLEETMEILDKTDYRELSEDDYNSLRSRLMQFDAEFEVIKNFFTVLQQGINDALTLCILRRWLSSSDRLFGVNEGKALDSYISGEINNELMTPLEGRLEDLSVKVDRIMSGINAPDMNAEEEEEYLDMATVARLLSSSLYAEIDPLFVESRQVSEEMLTEKLNDLIAGLDPVLKNAAKPVRRAIMSRILRHLVPLVSDGEGLREYISTNLFNCRDKAERCAVMAILLEMMEDAAK